MNFESPFASALSPLMTTKPSSPSFGFMKGSLFPSMILLPELDNLIASYLDRASLANAARASRLWHSIFNPVLWRNLSLQHVDMDDDCDEDFNFIRRPSLSSLPSLPSSYSSTWSSMSLSSFMDSPPSSPVPSSMPCYHNLSLLQQSFLYSSSNRILKGMVRHGHLVHELKATGLTDQEMGVVGVLCPNLRVLELIGGRYTAEDLDDLFLQLQDSLQVVRFRSCVQLNDIFQPLRLLANLREFELYGSFVGNTITSPYFLERDLIPVLDSCRQLRSILIEQVYIAEQIVSPAQAQGAETWNVDRNINDMMDYAVGPKSIFSSAQTSMLSVQLRSSKKPLALAPFTLDDHPLETSSSSLKSLTLDCGDIADSVILALLSKCPLLETLRLDWSRHLSDSSLLKLRGLCPNLTAVSLQRCVELTEKGFRAFFDGYPNLVSIDLGGNTLTDGVLESMSVSCRFLEELTLNNCKGISDIGIQTVLHHCAHLSYFSLRFVPGLSYLLFDDMMTNTTTTTTTAATAAATTTTSSSWPRSPMRGSLSSSPRFTWEAKRMPNQPRPWACYGTLSTLHLPNLVNPTRDMVEKKLTRQQQLLVLQDGATVDAPPALLTGDQTIQHRLQKIQRLEQLTIGGPSLEVLVVLDGLQNRRELKALRITRLKRSLALSDAQWLVEQAAPNLQRLAIPMFGNQGVVEWIEKSRPGLLNLER